MSTPYIDTPLDAHEIGQLGDRDLADIVGCLCALLDVTVVKHTYPSNPANYHFSVSKKDETS